MKFYIISLPYLSHAIGSAILGSFAGHSKMAISLVKVYISYDFCFFYRSWSSLFRMRGCLEEIELKSFDMMALKQSKPVKS